MKPLNAILTMCSIFSYFRTAFSTHKNSDELFKPSELAVAYEKVCNDMSFDRFLTLDRPKNMELALIEDQGTIGPVSCIPFDENQISDQCKNDIRALKTHKHSNAVFLAKLQKNMQAAAVKIDKQIGFTSGALEAVVGKNLAEKIVIRNYYFMHYFYSAIYNFGQSFELASQVFVDYMANFADETGQLPNMQVVAVKNKTDPSAKILNSQTRIYEHYFFVIGGELPAGESIVTIDTTKPIPEKFLKGWVCDLWNKDLVFGPLADIASNNKIYDLSKWESVEVTDISNPYFLGTEKSYDGIPNNQLKKYDYFLNPALFLKLLEENKGLTGDASAKRVQKALQLPIRIAAVSEGPEEDEPEHPEL